MATILALTVLAYLVGSIPSGYLLVRAFRRTDVREQGSRSIGAINVLRAGGPWLGLLTLLCDVVKGGIVVFVAVALVASPWGVAAPALAVLVGHAYSAWFLLSEKRFAEGKSVASTLGVLVSLAATHRISWLVPLIPLAVWGMGLLGPRLVTGRWLSVSLATMAATVSIPLVAWATGADLPWLVLTVLIALLILSRHRHNLQRLRAHTEPTVAETLRSRVRRKRPT
jgi:glycerol-3-phosphate acyltransferase PlsY